MKQAIITLWDYFRDMNSEAKDQKTAVSIKRNMAWGMGTLAFIVQVYCIMHLPKQTDPQLIMFINVCEFFAVLDISFVTLALSITSIEKLSELATKLKFGLLGGTPPQPAQPEKKEKDPENGSVVNNEENQQP